MFLNKRERARRMWRNIAELVAEAITTLLTVTGLLILFVYA